MTSDKKSKPRIDLSPLIHRLLLAESAKRGIRPNALVEKLIEEAASTEAKHLIGMNLEEKIDPQIAESANIPLAESAKLPFAQSPPSLESLNADELQVLKLLQEGTTVRTEIGEKMGISKSKAQEIVKTLKRLGLFYEKPNKRGKQGKGLISV